MAKKTVFFYSFSLFEMQLQSWCGRRNIIQAPASRASGLIPSGTGGTNTNDWRLVCHGNNVMFRIASVAQSLEAFGPAPATAPVQAGHMSGTTLESGLKRHSTHARKPIPSPKRVDPKLQMPHSSKHQLNQISSLES